MEILGKLFGSIARVKIMRLFLFNTGEAFDLPNVSQKSKVNKNLARRELLMLQKSGLIKPHTFYKTEETKKNGTAVQKRKKTKGFILNEHFSYLSGLRQLLVAGRNFNNDELLRKLGKAGKLKFVVISGVFTQDPESRLDMLVVGNNLNKPALSNIVRGIEAELGKELLYAHFETDDFVYRIQMYDKLIRDILDYPHKVLLDKLGME